MMKKLTALLTALFLLLSATALADEVIHIGIIQFAEHGSLDNCRIGFIEGLAEEGFVEGENVVFDVQNAQADTAISAQIADVMAGKYDMICAIATPAAMAAFNAAEDADIPVIYTAVSDPVSAMLASADGKNPGNITGTSDALNTEFIMDMMFAQNPNVAEVGLLYSLNEPNSAKPIADAKAYLDAKGITYIEQTANTNDEVVAAASALIAASVDAVFTPTDNVIMAAEMAIAEDLAANGIPHYTGADSFVRNGAYATCGVNYTDLGAKTADLAYKAITEGMDGMEDYYLMDGGIITVNTDTAAMIGKQAEYSCFDSMGTVVEVTTTKD